MASVSIKCVSTAGHNAIKRHHPQDSYCCTMADGLLLSNDHGKYPDRVTLFPWNLRIGTIWFRMLPVQTLAKMLYTWSCAQKLLPLPTFVPPLPGLVLWLSRRWPKSGQYCHLNTKYHFASASCETSAHGRGWHSSFLNEISVWDFNWQWLHEPLSYIKLSVAVPHGYIMLFLF
jgi:hypothetical protein